MNRIDQLGPGGLLGPAAQPKSSESGAGVSFEQTLQKALDTPEASSQVSTTSAPASVQAVSGPPAVSPAGPLQQEGMAQAERIMQILESYHQQLGDPSRRLKEMAPAVEELEGEVSRLLEVLDRLDPEDGLHPILQEVASTSLVEVVKFKRGDYIAE